MATVTSITAAKALEIEDASVVSGTIDSGTGHLILTTGGGTVIDAGVARPDAAIAAAVLVETNNRITDVNNEESARIADVNAEESARIAADSAAAASVLATYYTGGGIQTSTTGFVLAAGWILDSVAYEIVGRLRQLRIQVIRDGSTINQNDQGNSVNTDIFSSIPTALRPGMTISLSGPGTTTGRLVGVTISAGGVVTLCAFGGDNNAGGGLADAEVVSFGGLYLGAV